MSDVIRSLVLMNPLIFMMKIYHFKNLNKGGNASFFIMR
nr:MAG TPA: hypothetical protein [Caudoviricetes sp.]